MALDGINFGARFKQFETFENQNQTLRGTARANHCANAALNIQQEQLRDVARFERRFEQQLAKEQRKAKNGMITAKNPRTGLYESCTPEQAEQFNREAERIARRQAQQALRQVNGMVTAFDPKTGKYVSCTSKQAKIYKESCLPVHVQNNPVNPGNLPVPTPGPTTKARTGVAPYAMHDIDTSSLRVVQNSKPTPKPVKPKFNWKKAGKIGLAALAVFGLYKAGKALFGKKDDKVDATPDNGGSKPVIVDVPANTKPPVSDGDAGSSDNGTVIVPPVIIGGGDDDVVENPEENDDDNTSTDEGTGAVVVPPVSGNDEVEETEETEETEKPEEVVEEKPEEIPVAPKNIEKPVLPEPEPIQEPIGLETENKMSVPEMKGEIKENKVENRYIRKEIRLNKRFEERIKEDAPTNEELKDQINFNKKENKKLRADIKDVRRAERAQEQLEKKALKDIKKLQRRARKTETEMTQSAQRAQEQGLEFDQQNLDGVISDINKQTDKKIAEIKEQAKKDIKEVRLSLTA